MTSWRLPSILLAAATCAAAVVAALFWTAPAAEEPKDAPPQEFVDFPPQAPIPIAAAQVALIQPPIDQQAELPLNCAAPAPTPLQFKGNNGCRRCHDKPTDIDKRLGVTKFIAMIESEKWAEDKHSLSFKRIDPRDPQNALSRRICQQLNIDIKNFASSPTAKQCLSCHANWIQEKPYSEPIMAEGVNCEACHGPSEKWEGPHDDSENNFPWRRMSPVEKEKLGFVDLRNPVRRATQCFSCHVGNAAEGKVITHDMYAAGHPPLPSVEVETFLYHMPPHWRTTKKQDFAARAEYLKLNPSVNHPLQRTRSVLLSGLVSLRQTACLTAQTADQTLRNRENKPHAWPELALYDCNACHHDLRSPSWRQLRGYEGRPGRPLLHRWPTTLVRVGLQALADDPAGAEELLQQFTERQQAVHEALARAPFGRPRDVRSQCQELVIWLDKRIKELDDKTLALTQSGQQLTLTSLRRITTLGASQIHDFPSARVLAWATRALLEELPAGDARAAAANDLLVAEVQTLIDLTLPNKDASIEKFLPGLLKQQSNYDPAQFQAAMQKIARLLK